MIVHDAEEAKHLAVAVRAGFTLYHRHMPCRLERTRRALGQCRLDLKLSGRISRRGIKWHEVMQ